MGILGGHIIQSAFHLDKNYSVGSITVGKGKRGIAVAISGVSLRLCHVASAQATYLALHRN